jgi:hypothetical protein
VEKNQNQNKNVSFCVGEKKRDFRNFTVWDVMAFGCYEK